MLDSRVSEHAKLLVTYSTEVKSKDNVLIQTSDCGLDLASEIYKETAKRGASPLIVMTPSEVERSYFEVTSEQYLETFPNHLYELTRASDVIFIIRSESNTRTLSNVDSKKLSKRARTTRRILDKRLTKRWCLTQVPTPGYAEDAGMSLKDYEDFVYSAILIDWTRERSQMNKLKITLDKADEVRILGEETDLVMSIKGRNAIVGDAIHNVPGGEVYTAPVDNSAEGKILFDLPSIRYGREIRRVKLEFSKGEVIDYSAQTNEDVLKSIIETDAGSGRIGEFGIGTNRGIKKFTRNILFDEKMGDTIHVALGNAYKDCGGINQSAVHWDMIKTLKPGRITLDGDILQEDGRFSWE